MKIALVFQGLGVGGAERVGIDYIKMMLSMGYEIDVYNLNPRSEALRNEIPSSAKYIVKRFPRKYCPEQSISLIKKYWWGIYVLPFEYFIKKVIMHCLRWRRPKEIYDIAIAFSAEINDLSYVAYNMLKARKKVAWLHSGGLVAYLIRYDGYAIVLSKIKNIVVLSDLLQDQALSTNPLITDLNIRKLHNPAFADTSLIDNEKVREIKDRYGCFILSVMRFSVAKDHFTIIRALKILKDDGFAIKCVFLGDGSTRPKAEQYAKELDVADMCVFYGVSHSVHDFYSAAEVMVHSSPAEGLPLVFLEAMTYRLPVVTTNSLPGVYEVFENGKYAIVVPVGDASALAKGIKTMLTEPETRQRYIDICVERVKDFAPEKIKNDLRVFFSNLL